MGEQRDAEPTGWATSAEECWGFPRPGHAEGRSLQIRFSKTGCCASGRTLQGT